MGSNQEDGRCWCACLDGIEPIVHSAILGSKQQIEDYHENGAIREEEGMCGVVNLLTSKVPDRESKMFGFFAFLALFFKCDISFNVNVVNIDAVSRKSFSRSLEHLFAHDVLRGDGIFGALSGGSISKCTRSSIGDGWLLFLGRGRGRATLC